MQHVRRPPSELDAARQVPGAESSETLVLPWRELAAGWALLSLALVTGCSGQSNSVLSENPELSGNGGSAAPDDGSSPATGGTNATLPSGGSETVGGAPALSSGGGGGTGVSSGSCEERSNITLAVHLTVPVTWPGTLGTVAGSGDFNIWSLYTLAADGTELSGTISPCGSTLPPLTLSFLVGGGRTLIEFDDAMWDAPSFPEFDSSMRLSGWDPGSTLTLPSNPTLVGLTLADETEEWPDTRAEVEAVDADGDGNPGITGIPATGAGFTAPPVSIIGPGADQVHLVTRTAYTLAGTFTSCTELSGTATLTFFDNHVVGCRTALGEACTPGQADFVDSNRTIYESMPGTFRAQILDEGATCADARAIP